MPSNDMPLSAPPRPAHRDGNVLRWLTAYTLSLVGDAIWMVALGFAAQEVAGPAQVGMVIAAGAVPRALLMLGGGVVADRFGPGKVVIGSDAARCVIVLGIAAALWLTTPALWLLVAGAVLFGIVDALFMPAVGALPPRLTELDQIGRIQGLRMLVIRISWIAGPPLGGLAMAYGGAAAALGAAGLLFALSVPLLMALRLRSVPNDEQPTDTAPQSAWGELVDGLRYIRRHRVIGPLMISGAMSELGTNGLLTVGLILLCGDQGWGPSGFGWIVGAFGAGQAVCAALLAVKGRVPRAGLVQNVMLVVGSASVGAVAFMPTLSAAVGMSLLSGLLCGMCGGLAIALIQTSAEPGYLGRVTSAMSLTGVGLTPLSFPLFGAAISAWGVRPVFVVGAVFSALGAVAGLSSAAVRRAELPHLPGRKNVGRPAAAPAESRI
ncbi:MFS transporter [Streptomyces sp. TRM66268-LWL]|uniref:MFS transporter n=1 Tax=Streptomyces polyasparticus TaxID=2767826 RepID=A0ABR7SK94_9ACTN|nr:MFS transporter [Streptomyces polyasparticus]MBC9714773.1 MFS transporter [Streptomyces polyasparticus]